MSIDIAHLINPSEACGIHESMTHFPLSLSLSLRMDLVTHKGAKRLIFKCFEITGKPHLCCHLPGSQSFSPTNQPHYFSMWYPVTNQHCNCFSDCHIHLQNKETNQ